MTRLVGVLSFQEREGAHIDTVEILECLERIVGIIKIV